MKGIYSNKNIRFIDYDKAILMVLVVLGHINFANQGIKAWIFAFHMPAFFFASGLLLKTAPPQTIADVGQTLWKKFQTLMFPYFIWALIYASLSGANLVRILYGSHQTLIQAGALSSLWFLPALFLATSAYTLLSLMLGERFSKLVRLILALLVIIIAARLPELKNGYPWGANIAFVALGFLLLGNLMFPTLMRLRIMASASTKCKVLCAVTVGICFFGTLLYRFNIPGEAWVLVSEARYGNYGLFLLSSFVGTAFILLSAILLDALLPELEFTRDPLSFLGKNTLCVFVLQKPIIHVFQRLFDVALVSTTIELFVTCLATIVSCCMIACVLNRCFPTAVGRSVRRT